MPYKDPEVRKAKARERSRIRSKMSPQELQAKREALAARIAYNARPEVIAQKKAKLKAQQAAWREKNVPKKPLVTRTCAVCSAEFTTNQPKKLYCSEGCIEKAYKLRHGLPVTEPAIKACERCGDAFETTRSKQKFCSKTCKKAIHHKRQLERDPVKTKALMKAAQKRAQKKTKAAVLENYGNCCSWPSCDVTTGLHLHHVLLNGEQQREEVGNDAQLYAWVKRNGYPDTLQRLCAVHHRLHHKQVRQIAKLHPNVRKVLISVVLTKYRETLRKKPAASVRLKTKKAARA
jgi:hypothetical protein